MRHTASVALLVLLILTCATDGCAFQIRQPPSGRPIPVSSERWSLGYWTPWGDPPLPPAAIEWDALTHVVYAWALVRPNGSLDLETQRVQSEAPALIRNARKHGVKPILGVGQQYWSGQTTNFQSAISNHRARLVDNIMDVVKTYGFDGVDLDWEPFNAAVNGRAMSAFAEDLRSRLGTTRTLSASVIITDYVYWGSAHRPFDRIGVMTYDMAGTWDPYSWHNAALYGPSKATGSSWLPWSIDLAVRRFRDAGVPAEKLSIGLPFFGWVWSAAGVTEPGQRWTGKPNLRQIFYRELAGQLDQIRTAHWDSVARVPYLSYSDRFISYDNEQSIADKIEYVKSKGLGGWIIWAVGSDYVPSRTPNQPLLRAVKNHR
jgi:chitinase